MKNEEIAKKILEILVNSNCSYKNAQKILKYLKEKLEILKEDSVSKKPLGEIISIEDYLTDRSRGIDMLILND